MPRNKTPSYGVRWRSAASSLERGDGSECEGGLGREDVSKAEASLALNGQFHDPFRIVRGEVPLTGTKVNP